MWPKRGEALSRTLDAEDVLAELYTEAINAWVADGLLEFVLPTLTAATPPPDPSAIPEHTSALDRLLDTLVLAGLSTLWSLSLVEAGDGMGIDLPGIDAVNPNDAPDIPVTVIRALTSNTTSTKRQVEEAAAYVEADPYLRQQRDDFIETQHDLVHSTSSLVQAKVETAIRNAPVRGRAVEEYAPDVDVVIARQREAVAAVLTVGSDELIEVAQLQSYQAAGVQNAAVLQAAALSEDVLDKTWIATIDGKTRDSHFAADGQRTPLTGTFSVGGSTLRYPGDPAGPVREVRNCRCRVGVLAPDEEIPDEVDRHTERLDGRDSVAINRRGSQRDEIARRAADGTIRARDDEDGVGRTAAGGWAAPSEQEYDMKKTPAQRAAEAAARQAAKAGEGVMFAEQETGSGEAETFRTFTDQPVAFIGIETSDGRKLAEDIELTVRTPPLPVMWCEQQAGGHYDSYTVGVTESAHIDGDRVLASGYWLNGDTSDRSFDLAEHKANRPSVDLAATEWILTDEDGKEISEEDWWDLPIDAKVIQTITKAELIGFTMVATPAFGETMIEFNPERETRDVAVVASAAAEFKPRVYSAALFADPKLSGPTELQIDPDTGRVFGHLACFGACHRSIQANCVIAPRSPSDYSMFHTSPSIALDDGTRLPVGRLTVGTGHAPDSLSGGPAMAHYDNTGACWALVRAGEDKHGIWVSGTVAPWATPEQVEMALAAPLSGDWRDFGQGLDLIAALNVNTPGFVVRGRDGDNGRPAALVAAIGPARRNRQGSAQGFTADDIAGIVERAVSKALVARETALAIDSLVATAIEKVGPPPEPEPEKTPNDEIGELIAARGL